MSLVASLCSDSEELTNREPCRFVDGEPYMRANYRAHEGIADRLVVWCARSGEPVDVRMLKQLVVFEGDDVLLFDRVLVPAIGEWPEA